MPKQPEYRIKWGLVTVLENRHHDQRRERMCIAEKKHWFGWWPLRESDWRFTEQQALADIDYDIKLNEPLPAPRLVGAEELP